MLGTLHDASVTVGQGMPLVRTVAIAPGDDEQIPDALGKALVRPATAKDGGVGIGSAPGSFQVLGGLLAATVLRMTATGPW